MTFYDRFEELCKEVNLKPQSKEMQAITGVSSPSISNWKTKSENDESFLPGADVICRIARYFEVTTDYLMGLSTFRTANTTPIPLSEQEQLLIDAFRSANAEGQFNIIYVCMDERKKASSTAVHAG